MTTLVEKSLADAIEAIESLLVCGIKLISISNPLYGKVFEQRLKVIIDTSEVQKYDRLEKLMNSLNSIIEMAEDKPDSFTDWELITDGIKIKVDPKVVKSLRAANRRDMRK